jgi:hypothetical protein
MRIILLFLFIILLNKAFSQDTLYLNNGDTLAVKFIAADEDNGLIVYSIGSDTTFMSMRLVKTLNIYSGFSDRLPGDMLEKADKIEKHHVDKYEFFNSPAPDQKGLCAVSANLTSLIPNLKESYRLHYAINSVLTIEPEYYISDKMSIRIPVCIGINRKKPPASYTNVWNRYYFPCDPAETPRMDPTYFTNDFSGYNELHAPNMVFQVGVYTKHFSSISKRNYIYFTQGLNFGEDNYFAHDYHDYLVYSESQCWYPYKEMLTVYDNPAYYFRYELLIGMNISMGRHLCLNLESGPSIRMGSYGKKDDHLYRSLNNSDSVLIHTHHFEEKNVRTLLTFRISLAYRFRGKNNSG